MIMKSVSLPPRCDDQAFRQIARRLLAEGLAPEQVLFEQAGSASLFEEAGTGDAPAILMPRAFVTLLSKVICHSAADRFALLYRLLWRIHGGERRLLDRAHDADVQRATRYAKAVDRDVYRMHAFVRFTEREVESKTVFTAWFEPEHDVLRPAAPFFVDRFSNMDWLIATPHGTAAWHDKALSFGPPGPRPAPGGDSVLDDLWTTYYRTTFNPARLRVKAMLAQMPKRHWPTMPETQHVPEMIHAAESRVRAMEARAPDAPPKYAEAGERMLRSPAPSWPLQSLDAVQEEAKFCTRCPLHAPATQTVFGEGPHDAAIVFVGEQPGDQEDLAGRPFVGPAGQVFDRALAQAGIDRGRVYVTNAVKHFKFEPRGKRRIHSKPGTVEVVACRTWLQRELELVGPTLVVALGATAALSLSGKIVAVTKERGTIKHWNGYPVLVTVHPSYLLRIPDAATVDAEFERFVQDMRQARTWSEARRQIA
jgi:probable DNA metabolism protein